MLREQGHVPRESNLCGARAPGHPSCGQRDPSLGFFNADSWDHAGFNAALSANQGRAVVTFCAAPRACEEHDAKIVAS